MTINQLSANLRGLAARLAAKGRYDPATDCIATRDSTGGIEWGTWVHSYIYPLLLEARNGGAFDAAHLVEFKRRIDPTAAYPQGSIASAVLDELELRGFDCWGVKPDKGAIERLADALKAAAHAKGEISQADFARIAGISPGTVTRMRDRGVPITLTEANARKAQRASTKRSAREESDAEVSGKFTRQKLR